jgi:hypothetical protein
MSWCTDGLEDETISLFAGLLANPDVPLSLEEVVVRWFTQWLSLVCPTVLFDL